MAISIQDDVDLWQPCTSDVILELRTGNMQKMAGLEISSGIDKKKREGKVFLSFMGLDADEHDPTFHGGVDKAVHACLCPLLSLSTRKVVPDDFVHRLHIPLSSVAH